MFLGARCLLELVFSILEEIIENFYTVAGPLNTFQVVFIIFFLGSISIIFDSLVVAVFHQGKPIIETLDLSINFVGSDHEII